MKLFLALCLVPSLALGASSQGSGGKPGGKLSSETTAPMHSTSTGHSGGTGRLRTYDPREPPPLDPKREVSEQDCTKPVDLTKGNLKCK